MLRPFTPPLTGLANIEREVWPYKIEYSALLESGYSSTGPLATDATIALGWKPTKATTAPLNDMTGHYPLTIRKVGSTITVWKGAAELDVYGGLTGSTYAELIYNVLTFYGGSEEGYYSRLVIVESSLDWSSFWRVSPIVNGLYVPKGVSALALHTLLDFADAANLGKDVSGNGNDFTVSGSPIQTVDTPTNNHATLNPHLADTSLEQSAGNLITTQYAEGWDTTSGTLTVTGKAYAEFKELTRTDENNHSFGVFPVNIPHTGAIPGYLTDTGAGISFSKISSNILIRKDGVERSIGSGFLALGDIIGIAFDSETGEIWAHHNGNWLTGDPSAGEPIEVVDAAKRYSFASGLYRNSIEANFGATGFTYTPPEGFKSLCAANLPEPTILKSSTVADIVLFDAPTTADQDIVFDFDVATSDWLTIWKNRDSVESWGWVDTQNGLTNKLSSDTTAANNTISTLATSGSTLTLPDSQLVDGDSYLNTIMKAGVDQGFYQESGISHTNGVATPVTTGLGSPVTWAMIKRTDSTGDWWIFAGPLGVDYYGKFTTAAFVNSSGFWSTNTSTTFDIPASLATGTYVVYLLTDSDIFKAFSYTGNGSIDGPFVNLGGRPLSVPFLKNADASSDWWNFDSARNPHNYQNLFLRPNDSAAESVSQTALAASTGIKIVNNVTQINGNNNRHVGLAIMQSDQKYSNAF